MSADNYQGLLGDQECTKSLEIKVRFKTNFPDKLIRIVARLVLIDGFDTVWVCLLP